MSLRWTWDGTEIANEARRDELAITNLISNKHELNNCFIQFGTVLYLEIITKFYCFLNLQNDQKSMWQ